MSAIKLESVTKEYTCGDNPAVRDFSLEIREGEIITVLGPSGCGKTTLLRLIAGFEKPDRGRILLGKKLVSGKKVWIPPEKRGVGMVFQDYALFPHLNVFSNISFGYKKKDVEERVLELLDMVNLRGFANKFPHELSGGEQQRVALARALARKPVIIMLDEPFSSLDAGLRDSMRIETGRILKEAGTTALLVSHDQKDALAISDRVAVMASGTLQQIGTPVEVYRFPENRFVAAFVGQSNIFEGVIGDDARSLKTAIGVIPCGHTHGLPPGKAVYISIRPDSFEMASEGALKGKITTLIYTGEAYNAEVEVTDLKGGKRKIITHIHPEKSVEAGDKISLRILPEFVAVIHRR